MKRTQAIQLPAVKRRNPVARVLARLGRRGSVQPTHGHQERRAADLARMELDQRVREVGEW